MSRSPLFKLLLSVLLACMFCAVPAVAALTIPSDGSDGVFNPTASCVVDLSTAATGVWSTPGSGHGVYDVAKWAVTFKYKSVNIPAGVTVTFKNHASRAPVVWLVQGDVTIAGTVSLNGGDGINGPAGLTAPGPGGFPGGTADSNDPYLGTTPRSAGLGYPTAGGANNSQIPLIGGSGGIGGSVYENYSTKYWSGGGGGGAILIASTGKITLSGTLSANGGNGYLTGDYVGANGGSIRLVGDTIDGSGTVSAYGGGRGGSNGRIRFETNTITFTGIAVGVTPVKPQATPAIWPAATAPGIRILSIGGQTVPADPTDTFTYYTADVQTAQDPTQSAAVPVVIQATNVPLTWKVVVHAVSRIDGKIYEATATMQAGGTLASSTWSATLTLPVTNVVSVIARASAS